MIVEGIMDGNLPWNLIFIGMATAAMVELFGIGSLPFAVGLYLLIHLTAPIMFGGLVRGWINRREKDQQVLKKKTERGVLLASGYIAGEALMGVIIALAVTAGIGLPAEPILGSLASIIAFFAVAAFLYYTVHKQEKMH